MPRRTVRGLIRIVATAILAAGLPVLAAEPDVAAFTRVDVSDPHLHLMAVDGYRRSPTLRALVDTIESSPWMVFVQAGPCPWPRDTVGCVLHTVGHYQGAPYLRIRITTHGRHPDNMIATLGHELQHAVEIISAPGIAGQKDIVRMLEQIGFERFHADTATVFETIEAERIGSIILHELRTNDAVAADDGPAR